MKQSTPSRWSTWPKEKEWTKSSKWPSMRSFNNQVIKLKKELSKTNWAKWEKPSNKHTCREEELKVKLAYLRSTHMMTSSWGNRRWTTLLVFGHSLLLAILLTKVIIYPKHPVLLPTVDQIKPYKPRQQVLSSLCHRRISTEQPMETVVACSKCHPRHLSHSRPWIWIWRDSLLSKKRKRISLITMSMKLIQMKVWAPSTVEKESRMLGTTSLRELSTGESQLVLM